MIELRGGVMQGRPITGDEVEALSKLRRSRCSAARCSERSPRRSRRSSRCSTPLQNLVGLIDARIDQLKEQGDTSAAEAPVEAAQAAEEPAPAEEETQTTEADATESANQKQTD